MKKERKFRFVGRPSDYSQRFEQDIIYKGSFRFPYSDNNVCNLSETYPEDWEEVTEQEEEVQIHNRVIHSKTETNRIPNQDQPASSMTKFEKCVIDIIGNIYSNINIKTQTHTYQEISQIAINQAKETFKQLSECQE